MSDDPMAVLERELVGAARRRIASAPPEATGAPRDRLRGLALVAAVLIPVLAVVVALTLTSTRSPGTSAAGGSGHGPTLRGELAVLRRPQQPSDLTRNVQGTAQATVERSLMRRVVVRPSGAPAVAVELIVSVAARPGAAPRLSTFVTRPVAAGTAEMIMSTPVTAGELRMQGLVSGLGGRDVAVIVPDGVATVVFTSPGISPTGVRVRENVAALHAAGHASGLDLAHLTMRWYDAGGHLLRAVQVPSLQTPPPRTLPERLRATPPSPQSGPLRSLLEILRRPQSADDLTLPAARTQGFTSPSLEAQIGTPEFGLMRLVARTPWGQRLFLVPYRPATPGQIDGLPRRLRAQARRQARVGEELFYYLGSGAGGQIGTAADVAAGRALAVYGGGVQAGKVLVLQLILVVPDGVSAAGFTVALPSGQHTYRVPVRGNVAALQVRTGVRPLQIVWYGRDGTVLKRYSPAGG